jgi:hypothetical protein
VRKTVPLITAAALLALAGSAQARLTAGSALLRSTLFAQVARD